MKEIKSSFNLHNILIKLLCCWKSSGSRFISKIILEDKMRSLKIFLVVIAVSLFASNILAQENSVDQMMKNSKTRNQVMDYMITHSNIINEFMDKMMSNKDAWNSMMSYMMSNKDSRMSMMNNMFWQANNDKSVYDDMQKYMITIPIL